MEKVKIYGQIKISSDKQIYIYMSIYRLCDLNYAE